MIGVIANPADYAVVAEFFQLFKTPWEFYRNDRRYEVVLCNADSRFDENTAKLVLIYAGKELPFDAEQKIEIASRRNNRMLSYRGTRIPIYGDSVTFREKGAGALFDDESQNGAMHRYLSRETVVARIGYELFGEVRRLLTEGQPAANSAIPTLDLHIAILRDLIVANGVAVVEIPPVPDGYKFIACLTHDIDHPAIRPHKWDHTMFGFLYRAIFGSLKNFFRGRVTARNLLTNWAAALKLPFVYLGLAKDFWCDFAERYLKLETGLRSTFFVIPFKNRQGQDAPKFRAAHYGAQEVADSIQKIVAAGGEVGLHGIDAWADTSRGRDEIAEIRHLTGASEIGVRMHWLYYDEQSPVALEQAGADYDSTIGYNETVGYRSGTTQVYKPLHVTRLLELPLHVMDTALFYPGYLNLSPSEAGILVGRIIKSAVQFGGCVTVSWHDRSTAPERLWGDSYSQLVEELRNNGAWFATAAETVSWFRKRRSATFEKGGYESEVPAGTTTIEVGENLPGLQLRAHKCQEANRNAAVNAVAS
jgi:hypothetical protein